MSKIAVIIPLYNKERFIVDCLESLRRQNFGDFEAIVIDDGSTDKSRLRVEEFLATHRDERFIFISRENRGVSATLNEGLSLIDSPYFTRLDADDLLPFDALEYLIEAIESRTADLVHASLKGVTENVRLDESQIVSPAHNAEVMDSGTKLLRQMFNNIDAGLMSLGAALYKTELIKKHHLGFNEEVSHTEDLLFNAHYYAIAGPCVVSEKVCYFYRKTAGSLSRGYRQKGYLAIDALHNNLLVNPRPDFAKIFEKSRAEILDYLSVYYALTVLDEVKAHAGAEPRYDERIADFINSSSFIRVMEELKTVRDPRALPRLVYRVAKKGSYKKLQIYSAFINGLRALRRSFN